MKATYVDHMGSDLSVVNAARVSFDKRSDWSSESHSVTGEFLLQERDAKLIRYLARHNHWTPFGHTSITIHCKAPIFVARQLAKHQTGLVWNEVSRRYVDSEPEFFEPESWRKRPDKSIKQGSSDETIEDADVRPVGAGGFIDYHELVDCCAALYQNLLDAGVAPEQARMVLPQSAYTEWYWTGSLAAFARVCKLRLAPDTQKETRDIALDIAGIMSELYPVSWKALLESV